MNREDIANWLLEENLVVAYQVLNEAIAHKHEILIDGVKKDWDKNFSIDRFDYEYEKADVIVTYESGKSVVFAGVKALYWQVEDPNKKAVTDVKGKVKRALKVDKPRLHIHDYKGSDFFMEIDVTDRTPNYADYKQDKKRGVLVTRISIKENERLPVSGVMSNPLTVEQYKELLK